jgi:hypothetical protein
VALAASAVFALGIIGKDKTIALNNAPVPNASKDELKDEAILAPSLPSLAKLPANARRATAAPPLINRSAYGF